MAPPSTHPPLRALQVYEMAIDTILLSFCEDCERTDGNPQFAPKLLLSSIGKSRESQAGPSVTPEARGGGEAAGKEQTAGQDKGKGK